MLNALFANSEIISLLRRILPCVRFVGERRGKVLVKTVRAVLDVCRG